MLIQIALSSLRNRKHSAMLTLFSMVISMSLLFGVIHIKDQAKNSFNRTVSGVDLIVGARTGNINLLLYSVFHVGNATNNIDWQSIEFMQQRSDVDWVVPLSLGDSHRGYRVMGTTDEYFQYFKYGNKRPLSLAQGEASLGFTGAVLGAKVAAELGYEVGHEFPISHGVGQVSFKVHDHIPFTVVGILEATGTPVDKTIMISLSGLEAAHLSPSAVTQVKARLAEDPEFRLPPKQVTAALLGLTSRIRTFTAQRAINQYEGEPLLAILPGVALSELWQILGMVENILLFIAILILISSLTGMATMLLASMRERRREMAVLRAVGTGPWVIFLLIQAEALMLSLLSAALSVLLVWGMFAGLNEWLASEFGLFVDANILNLKLLAIIGMVMVATFVVALIPAIGAYRQSVHLRLSS